MEYKVAVLPGDGIGPEIIEEAVRVIRAVEEKYGLKVELNYAPVGGAAWEEHGNHLPEETLKICRESAAILFGAVGGPVSEQNLPKWKDVERTALLGLRKEFDLFANLRHIRLPSYLSGASPLKNEIVKGGFDIMFVRELTGGIYFADPKGRAGRGSGEKAFDTMVYHRWEIERIARLAFEIARKRKKKLTSIDKANVLTTMSFWREVVEEVATEYPDVNFENMLVDNAAMQLVKNPGQFDVVLCGNMFGDILTDEAAGIAGSLGMLPSASLREDNFGMYEPGGGSAPDIAGKGIANPIAQILSAAMMFKYTFGREDISKDIEKAVDNVLERGYRTLDIALGNVKKVSTKELGEMIVNEVLKS
ncbi:MAG: 3-isopropylmalate dehydrogenase [Candidatus Neomarinimicrobiota bacterium]|nr:MAG: 3-isopropylmalate dehydrogenase [Candidatus Neomarinimicrobiota bacterium]